HQTELALRQAQYEVTRTQRQYDAVDPSNRLVASELERRWNEALKAQSHLEEELRALQREQPSPVTAAIKAELLTLADDLPRLWDHPKSLPEHKKRILRTVLKEIVAQSAGDTIKLILHWQGGDHTELQFPKTRTGQHRYVSPAETVELIRSLATMQPDSMIASILNRMKVQTAHGQSWTAMRVCSIRHHHGIERYREEHRQARGEMRVSEVAALLNVTPPTVLRMIRQGRLPATQVCANAPWILLKKDVESLQGVAGRGKAPQTVNEDQLTLKIQ
ncbi:recombinase, partial [mine drainage metagenome]